MATESTTDVDETRRTLAAQIARLRKARGFTQGEVSDLTGLGRTAVSDIEHGHRSVSVADLIALARVFGIAPGTMLTPVTPIAPAGRGRSVSEQLAALSRWIDASNLHRDPEAVTWGRLAKLQEEAGEVVSAFIGATGQNPRKGVTHSRDDVVKELLDVAVTALGAVEHMVGNDGSSMNRLAEFVGRLIVRAGLDQRQDVA